MKTLLVNNSSPYINNIKEMLNDLHQPFTCWDCNCSSSLDTDFLLDLKKYDHIVLSGRQRNSAIVNRVNSQIVKWCDDMDKPLLGICYGGQILALTLGCTLKRIGRVYDMVQIDILQSTHLLPNYKTVNMFESHRFCISRLSRVFTLLGRSNTCANEFFCHSKKPLYGTQFHPEKSGRQGKILIENFLRI